MKPLSCHRDCHHRHHEGRCRDPPQSGSYLDGAELNWPCEEENSDRCELNRSNLRVHQDDQVSLNALDQPRLVSGNYGCLRMKDVFGLGRDESDKLTAHTENHRHDEHGSTKTNQKPLDI